MTKWETLMRNPLYLLLKIILRLLDYFLKIMKACEVTIGISISFCSVRVERFIRRNYELIMAPDFSFEENLIPHLAGHNVFNSTGKTYIRTFECSMA